MKANRKRCPDSLPTFQTLEPRMLLSASWNVQTLASGGGTDLGEYTSIAVDGNDYPHVSYYQRATGDLMYTAWNGTAWTSPSAVATVGDVGQFTSIAIDGSDHPRISFYDATNGDLKYAAWDGSSWNVTTVASAGDVGEYTSLALDGSDDPRVVYYDRTNGSLRFAAYEGSSWSIDRLVASVGTVGEQTSGGPLVHGLASLALDGAGVPHVSFYDDAVTDLKYARWNGSAWDIETVDSAGDVGTESSLALGGGYAQISYFDHANSDLKYAAWDGSAWQVEVVDSAGYVGGHAAMALDGAGSPLIAYYDQSNKTLKYAHYDAGAWEVGTIDADQYSGEYPSVALDGQGKAHVAYHKTLYYSKQLKYASADGFPQALPPYPDLVVQIGPGVPDVWLPGDKLTVPVVVTNNGPVEATGPITIELWVSDDGTVSYDHHVDTLDASVSLAQGDSKTFFFKLFIPPEARPGEAYLLAEAIPDPSVGETFLANNVDVADTPADLVWMFGTFGDRKNSKLTVEDDNDVLVTFSLSGDGYGEVGWENDRFDEVRVWDTTPKSSLTIKTPGKLETAVRNIVVEGPLKGLTAKTTDLLGNMYVHGPVAKLVMDDVDVGHTIDINGGGDPVLPKETCSIVFDEVYACVLYTHGLPLKSVTVTEWTDGGVIQAPWLGKFTVKGDKRRSIGGDSDVHLQLDGARAPKYALGGVKIAGDSHDSTWQVAGDVGSIAAGGVSWSQIDVQGGLKSLKAGSFEDSEMQVDGPAGAFTVGNWDDSDLTADSLKSLKTARFHKGRLTLHGTGVPAGKPVLASAKTGPLTNTDPDRGWEIGGPVGKIMAGETVNWSLQAQEVKSLKLGRVENTEIAAAGSIGSVDAYDWNGGALTASSIKSVKIKGDKKTGLTGDLAMVDLLLGGEGVDPGKPALGALAVAGHTVDTVINVTGDVGKIATRSLQASTLFLGCDDLTGSVDDFSDGVGGTHQFTLKSLTLNGEDTHFGIVPYFEDSSVGAWTIGLIKFKRQPAHVSGVLEFYNGPKVVNEPEPGAPVDDLIIYELNP